MTPLGSPKMQKGGGLYLSVKLRQRVVVPSPDMGAIASPMESHDLRPAISDEVSSSTSESCRAAIRQLNPESRGRRIRSWKQSYDGDREVKLSNDKQIPNSSALSFLH